MREYNNKFHFNNVLTASEQIYSNIRVFQIGDLSCQSDSIIPRHDQFCCEISVIVEGEGTFIVNDTPIKVRKGDVHFSFLGDTHEIVSNRADPLRYFFLGFEYLLTHPLYNYLKTFSKSYASPSLRIMRDKHNIADCFVRCLTEFAGKDGFSNLLVASIIEQIIIYSLENYTILKNVYSPDISDKSTFVYNIINYIDQNADKIKKVTDLCEQFNYSVSHLSHVFSQQVGRTLTEYISDKKMERAKQLLANKKISITQVAELLGYSSIHPFSRAFKTKYGIPPQKYSD